jgi:hypothetical protein
MRVTFHWVSMVRFAPPSKPVTLAPATEQCQIKSELIHLKLSFLFVANRFANDLMRF